MGRCPPRYAALVAVIGYALVCALPGQSVAREFFVDAIGGSDTNSGRSPGEAWRSLDKVNEIRLQPGDTVFLRRGAAWRGKIEVQASGQPGAPIIYGAYGTGPAPVLYGVDNGIAGERQRHIVIRDIHIRDTSYSGIFVQHAKDWRFERLTIERTGEGKKGGGITWWHGDGLSIIECTMTDVRGDGIWAWNVDGLKIIDNRIMTVQGETADNLHIYKPRNFEIRGNLLSMEGKTNSGKGNVFIFAGDKGVITGNVFAGGSFGLSTTASNVSITDNRFMNHNRFKWSAGLLMGEDTNVANNMIARNVFSGGRAGVYIFNRKFTRDAIVIRENVFEDLEGPAVVIQSTVSGAFVNNTIRSPWAARPLEFSGSVDRAGSWRVDGNVVMRTERKNGGKVR